MSASGYKRTYSGKLANVRFTPESRHSEALPKGQPHQSLCWVSRNFGSSLEGSTTPHVAPRGVDSPPKHQFVQFVRVQFLRKVARLQQSLCGLPWKLVHVRHYMVVAVTGAAAPLAAHGERTFALFAFGVGGVAGAHRG